MGVFDDFKKNIKNVTTAFASLPLTADLDVGAVYSILSGKTLDEVLKEADQKQLAQMDAESMLGGAPPGKAGLHHPLLSPVPMHIPEEDFVDMVPMPEPTAFPMDPSIGADEYLLEDMLGF